AAAGRRYGGDRRRACGRGRPRQRHDHQYRLDRCHRAGNPERRLRWQQGLRVAFSQSLKHELADKNIRVQAVLPGATITEFWNIAGTPVEHLPGEIVMSAEEMVNAALAGLNT